MSLHFILHCDIFMLQTYNLYTYKFHIHLLHKAIFMLLHASATIVAITREPQYYQDIKQCIVHQYGKYMHITETRTVLFWVIT